VNQSMKGRAAGLWVGSCLGAFLVSLASPHFVAADGPAARHSAVELRHMILAASRRVNAVRVAYRSYDYDAGTFPQGTYLHRVVVAKAPYYLFHLTAHGNDALDWTEDFYQQRAYITARQLYNEFPVNRVFFGHFSLIPTGSRRKSLSLNELAVDSRFAV
jgi:hypothetical protein